jgi:hypothetical protein
MSMQRQPILLTEIKQKIRFLFDENIKKSFQKQKKSLTGASKKFLVSKKSS